MTLMPTFLAGTNWVMHSAGWLEGGLVAGYEKFIVDIELLQMMQVEFTPLEIDEESLAFGAHEEVGSGGHFLGAMHTMERFRTCFYRPLLSSSDNYERWMRNGGNDAAARATKIYHRAARDVRAAAARRGDPPGDGGVREPPPQGARRLMAPHHLAARRSTPATPPATSCSSSTAPTGPGSCTRSPGSWSSTAATSSRASSSATGSTVSSSCASTSRWPTTTATVESLRADFAEVASRFEMSFEIWGTRERRTAP